MNHSIEKKKRMIGVFLFVGIITGIFSIAPTIDSANYLTKAVANSNGVTLAAFFQLIMSSVYLSIALLLYPIIKKYDDCLSIGFLSFRIIAVCLSIIGTVLMLSILALSDEYVKNSSQDILLIETLGNVLKITRDYMNHIFMISILCTGNIMLYILLLKSKLIPKWISIWGIIGAALSIIGSLLVLFKVLDIITSEYILFNMPIAIQEIILGIWLITKGFNKKANVKKSPESSTCKTSYIK